MKADLIISIYFLTTEEGGRAKAIQASKYGCPLVFQNQYFDCRFLLQEFSEFELGKTYEIPIKFLSPHLILDKVSEGDHVNLWEGKIIADGKIQKICEA